MKNIFSLFLILYIYTNLGNAEVVKSYDSTSLYGTYTTSSYNIWKLSESPIVISIGYLKGQQKISQQIESHLLLEVDHIPHVMRYKYYLEYQVDNEPRKRIWRERKMGQTIFPDHTMSAAILMPLQSDVLNDLTNPKNQKVTLFLIARSGENFSIEIPESVLKEWQEVAQFTFNEDTISTMPKTPSATHIQLIKFKNSWQNY